LPTGALRGSPHWSGCCIRVITRGDDQLLRSVSSGAACARGDEVLLQNYNTASHLGFREDFLIMAGECSGRVGVRTGVVCLA
jgi:hypothetical protein